MMTVKEITHRLLGEFFLGQRVELIKSSDLDTDATHGIIVEFMGSDGNKLADIEVAYGGTFGLFYAHELRPA